MMSQKGLFIVSNNTCSKSSVFYQSKENKKQISKSFKHGKKIFQSSDLSKISLELLKNKTENA